ncbi:MAG: DUF302 domain-containing protein [Bacteroidota bacterium]|nr:DUF302 domain-containing protein [Bacteroidota bacterium]
MSMQLGITKQVDLSFDEAIKKVTDELQKEGFGVLTTIDVKETIQQKLNLNFRKYTILGACNPTFAHQALEIDDSIGLLLPCNIVIQEKSGKTEISIFNPSLITNFFQDDHFEKMSVELRGLINRVLQHL